jgi:hypothetical protein
MVWLGLRLLSLADRALLIICGPDVGPSGGVTGELLTLPRPSSVVRCRPFLQVNDLCLFTGVVLERCEYERLAVNLAVNALAQRQRLGAASMPLLRIRRSPAWSRLALDSLDLPIARPESQD